MKIISIIHKLLCFKATDLYTLDTKIWKSILKLKLKILKLKLKY